jgi:hypothetical protein
MSVFQSIDFSGHEQVVHVADAASGLRAIIAIHSTALARISHTDWRIGAANQRK